MTSAASFRLSVNYQAYTSRLFPYKPDMVCVCCIDEHDSRTKYTRLVFRPSDQTSHTTYGVGKQCHTNRSHDAIMAHGTPQQWCAGRCDRAITCEQRHGQMAHAHALFQLLRRPVGQSGWSPGHRACQAQLLACPGAPGEKHAQARLGGRLAGQIAAGAPASVPARAAGWR